MGTAFGKFKSGFIERNRSGALARYAEVRDLRSGKWDKYLYALNSWGFILLWLLYFYAATIVVILTNDPTVKLGAMGSGTVSMLFATMRMASLFLAMNRVRNFEDYRAALLRRWPDIKLPDGE